MPFHSEQRLQVMFPFLSVSLHLSLFVGSLIGSAIVPCTQDEEEDGWMQEEALSWPLDCVIRIDIL